jgi:hypothetical protein
MGNEVKPSKPLTDPQLAMLLRLADGTRGPSGLIEFVCATRGEFMTVRALHRRGLVQWRYIATRLFGAQLTVLGREVLAATRSEGSVQ